MGTVKIKIASLNTKGLITPLKREKIFRWLERKKYNVIFLQETHSVKNRIPAIKASWKGESYFCETQSAFSKGVGFLFCKRLNVEIINLVLCKDERKQLLNAKINNSFFSLVNVYAPNNETQRVDFLDD